MSVTHKKRLFAMHFAKNGDRQSAVEHAGYANKDWPRTATRLLGDPEVLGLIEKQQKRELDSFDVAKIDDAFVLGEMNDLLQRIRACGMGSWQATAEMKLLELLGKYRGLFSDRVELGLDEKFIQILQQGRERARRAVVESASPAPLLIAAEVKPDGE